MLKIFLGCSLVICAFMMCLGMTLLILACAVPKHKVFYPFFVLIFYLLSALPMLWVRNRSNGLSGDIDRRIEIMAFFTTGMIFSAFALPIVLAHSLVVRIWNCIIRLTSLIIFEIIFSLDNMDGVWFNFSCQYCQLCNVCHLHIKIRRLLLWQYVLKPPGHLIIWKFSSYGWGIMIIPLKWHTLNQRQMDKNIQRPFNTNKI